MMKKIIFFMMLMMVTTTVIFSNELSVQDNVNTKYVQHNLDNLLKLNNSATQNRILALTPYAYSGNKDLAVYKDLFFGLTIAFGVATFTFMTMAIAISSVYGVSGRIIREATFASDVYNQWFDAQPGLLAGTISSWSLFTLFAICGTATGIIYMMAVPNKAIKSSRLEIKGDSVMLAYTF